MNARTDSASTAHTNHVPAVFSHFGICVRNLDETYGRAVGDDFARLMQRPSLDSYICILALGDRRVELIHHNTPPARVDPLRPTNVVGLTHMAIYVPDLEPAAQLVEQYGGKPLRETHTRIDVDGDTREYMTVLDPNEVRIELIRGLPLG
jgi:hypothetical protein